MKFIQNTTKGGFFRFPVLFSFVVTDNHENSISYCFAVQHIEAVIRGSCI